jgi:DNA-binding MarR family transcriptional regulator
MPAASGSSSEAIDLGPLLRSITYMLGRAQAEVHKPLVEVLEPFDLRPNAYAILVLVGHAPDRNQSDIGDALGIQRANFVGLVKRLESRGLLRRRADDDDKRALFLRLTKSGKTLLGRVKKADAGLSKQLVRKLEGEHRTCLTHLRILANLG